MNVLLSCLYVLSWQITPSYTKDLMHQRIRQQQQEQLQHFQQQQQQYYRQQHLTQEEDLHRHFSSRSSSINNITKPSSSSAQYQDFEASVVSWTGAKLNDNSPTINNNKFLSATQQSDRLEMFQRRLEHMKQDDVEIFRKQQQQEKELEQQDRGVTQNFMGSKRRKTKSGLLIESNIELDYSDLSSTAASYEYETEADLLKSMATTNQPLGTTTNYFSSHTNKERKRNRQQLQRKRNGRNGGGANGGGAGGSGQRQKLQRNGKFSH